MHTHTHSHTHTHTDTTDKPNSLHYITTIFFYVIEGTFLNRELGIKAGKPIT